MFSTMLVMLAVGVPAPQFVPLPQFTPLPVFVAERKPARAIIEVPVTAVVKAAKATEEVVEWVRECGPEGCRMVPRVVKKTEAAIERPPLPPRPRRLLIRPWR